MQFVDIPRLLTTFEESANAGPDREIFQCYLKDFFPDGSGKLRIELASTQARNGDERLVNRLFCPAREFTFENMDQLEGLLTNLDLVNASHPEHEANNDDAA